MNWQNHVVLVVLPILLFSRSVQAEKKISPAHSSEIIRFALFNYDNLIADHFEKKNEYIGQLAYLLYKNTGCPTENFTQILNSQDLVSEDNPVRYLVKINQETKRLCGYYFVDD